VPGCIVGTGLYLKGYADSEILMGMDENPTGGSFDAVVQSGAFPVSITEDAVDILTAAQGKQDADCTWGEALAFAREVASLAREGK
jgi:hypothetical protein